MEVTELAVPGTYEFAPRLAEDERGLVLEAMRGDAFTAATGFPFHLAQVNLSVSRRGVIRGIHYVALPGQEKYVCCVRGAVLDIAVDLRTGSPSFGEYAVTRLDDTLMRAVYMPVGVGHAYLSLTDDSTVVYLMSAPYIPDRQRAVHPLAPELGLPWDQEPAGVAPVLSKQDDAAPGLTEAAARGLLPSYDACLRIDALRGRTGTETTEPRRDAHARGDHVRHQAGS